MTPQALWGLAALCGAATLYCAWLFFRLLRRDRFAADTPLARIRSAAQGYVRLEGHLEPSAEEGELTSPLTHRHCVWWDYKVESRQSGGVQGRNWHCIERGTSVTPFTLRDADGACLVGPVGADIIPTTHNVWHGATPRPDGPPATATFTSYEQPYRYTESVLTAGTRVTVLGELRSHSVVDSIEEEVRTTLAEWKRDPAALLARFDRNHDGQLDMDEWEAVRAAARAEVQARAGTAGARQSIVGQTTHGQPFLIAPFDGAGLVQREKHRAALAFAATLVLAGLTAWSAQHALTAHPSSMASAAGPPAQP